jgi:hypothetical protein
METYLSKTVRFQEPSSVRAPRYQRSDIHSRCTMKLPSNPQMPSRSVSSSIAALSVVALMLTIRMIPHFGVYYDEALYAPALYQPDAAVVHIEIFGVTLPVMTMAYIGALKLYLWKLLFAVWYPSVWSIRIPMLLIAAICAGVWGHTLNALGARRAAGTCIGLLLTSATFLTCSTFDWGPVALQMLLGACAVNLISRGRYPFLAGLLCGLAVWDKLTFIFAYGPLLAMLAWRRPRWLTAAGLTVGLSPLLYALTTTSPAQSLVVSVSPELLWGRLAIMSSTLTGSSFFGFMASGRGVPDFPPLILPIIAIAFIVAGPWRRTRLGIAACLILSWCAMALFNNIGMSVHHAVLLFPLVCALIALTVEDSGNRPWEAALLPLAALNIYSLYALGRAAPRPLWSPVLNELPARIAVRDPRLILCEDWGLQNGIWLLSRGSVRPTSIIVTDRMNGTDRNNAAAALATPGALFLGFTDGNRAFPKGHEAIQSLATELGYEKASIERVKSIIEMDTYFIKPRK